MSLMRWLHGAQGRNRTTDTVIFSHVHAIFVLSVTPQSPPVRPAKFLPPSGLVVNCWVTGE